MATPPPSAVLLDLDGTIVQTRHASWEIFHEVSKDFGLGIDEPEGFYDLLQDNLFDALRRVCSSPEEAVAVKDAFYRRLGESYEPHMVPGMTAVIRVLATHCPISVVSSNSMAVLRRILTDSGLELCFSHVFGGDVVESKRSAIDQFLADGTSGFSRQCQSAYAEEAGPGPVDPDRTVLVTDTAGDIREARAAGIRAVGVSWGMHSSDELTSAGAEFVAIWPEELLSHLLGELATRPVASTCALPGMPTAAAASAPSSASSAGPSQREGAPTPDCSSCRCASGCPVKDAQGPVARTAGSLGTGPTAERRRTNRVAAAAATRRRVSRRGPMEGQRTSESLAAAVRSICA